MPRQRRQPAVTAPIEDVDLPPDRHPARRPVLFLLLLLAALVLIVRAGWGWIAERRLNAVLLDLQRRGLLVSNPSLPLTEREHDALASLRSAANAAVLSEAELDACWDLDPATNAPSPSAVKARAAVVQSRSRALANMRRARQLAEVRWPPAGDDFKAELAAGSTLNRLQDLAQILRFAAFAAHASGDDRAEIELVRDMLFVGRATTRFPSSIALPIAWGIDAIALETIDSAGLKLRIGSDSGGATAAQLRSLINELLDDREFQVGLPRQERLNIAQTIRWIDQCRTGKRQRAISVAWDGENADVDWAPQWVNLACARIAGPYYALRGGRALRYEAAIAGAMHAHDYVSTIGSLPPPPPTAPRSYLFGADWVAREFGSPANPRQFLKDYFLVQQMRRLAAAQFAVEPYSSEHHGQLPPNLDALVPAFLPAVPADLFAGGGVPIKYVPAATQPFVYSVGENGVDDFAAGNLANTDGWSYEVRLRAPDLIWYVSPPRSTTKPVGG